MIHPAWLRLAALMIATTIPLAGPAHARTDWQIDMATPHWLDQTVYRPNCLPADCACACRSERLCLPACVRW
jgi:hypothetical protein